MTRERIIELLDLTRLVNSIRDTYDKRDVLASIEVDAYSVDVYIHYFVTDLCPEDGVEMYKYTTDRHAMEYLENNIRSVIDPWLKKAEEHLRRLINDVDR